MAPFSIVSSTAAALVWVAPLARDSGTLRGKRAVLYMGALVACMRKLLTIRNAMMRTNTTWQHSAEEATA